jgi:acylphosphatase
MLCIKGYVSGRVQGVGFRYFLMRHADDSNIHGYAKNLPDGRVEFLLQGEDTSVRSVVEIIRNGPSFSVVTDVEIEECECQDLKSRFLIL